MSFSGFYCTERLKAENKNNVILSIVNVHHVQQCMHSLFSSCLMKPGDEFLQ
jgi:hypothetical protein